MRYLIYGAGTIGTVYAFLLSQAHEIDLLVRRERLDEAVKGVPIALKDLRKRSARYEETVFYPNCVTEIAKRYDGILVTVNRFQLKDVLPVLAENRGNAGYFAFMQNHWDIKREIEAYLTNDRYIAAFPSSVGGGRDERGVQAILFDEATRLGGACRAGADDFCRAFKAAGIRTHVDGNIFGWLKVHYLQQSVTAGAILEKGDFQAFARDDRAVRKMVKAFREGIAVCRLQGVNINKTFPANLFRLPVWVLAHAMQKMLLDQNTVEMVGNHMKKGLPEWIFGYREVLADGLKKGFPMTAWKSYHTAVEKYLQANPAVFPCAGQ